VTPNWYAASAAADLHTDPCDDANKVLVYRDTTLKLIHFVNYA